MSIKARENKVRRQLARDGYRLRKSRTDGCVYTNGIFEGYNLDDRGGYMVVNMDNAIVAGEKFDMSLEDVERFAAG